MVIVHLDALADLDRERLLVVINEPAVDAEWVRPARVLLPGFGHSAHTLPIDLDNLRPPWVRPVDRAG